MSKFLKYGLPALLWATLIFVLSSIPRLPPPAVEFRFSDKIYHVVEFFIFGLLLARASMNLISSERRGMTVLTAALLGILWGGLDEVHQAFIPGRDCSFLDGVADAVGVAIACVLFWWQVKKKKHKGSLV